MLHPWVLHNDRLRPASEAAIAPAQTGALSGWGVFSTIRVAQGILFEFPRHYARMKRDAAVMRVPFPEDAAELERSLMRLAEANGESDCTLRVAVMRNQGGFWSDPAIRRPYDVFALTADLHQWQRTVKLGLGRFGRYAASRFAGVKVLSWAENLVRYEEARTAGFDEVLLLNEREEISECTSANIFLAFGGEVLTPPLSSGCLPGVTREVLLECVRVNGVTVTERGLSMADIERADEVFITSTTRALLAVLEIDGKSMRNEGTARAALEEAFGKYIDEYTRTRRAILDKM